MFSHSAEILETEENEEEEEQSEEEEEREGGGLIVLENANVNNDDEYGVSYILVGLGET